MPIDPHIGVNFLTREIYATPQPANENLRLKPDWMTPAELMQFIRKEKELLAHEVMTNPSLLNDPTHRRWRDETLAYEACALWRLYGVR